MKNAKPSTREKRMFDRAESVEDTLSNTRHCLPVRAVLYNNRIFKLYSPYRGLYFSYPIEIVISNSLEKYYFIRSITLSNRNFYCVLLPNVWRNFLRLFSLLFNSLLLNRTESWWYFSSVCLSCTFKKNFDKYCSHLNVECVRRKSSSTKRVFFTKKQRLDIFQFKEHNHAQPWFNISETKIKKEREIETAKDSFQLNNINFL